MTTTSIVDAVDAVYAAFAQVPRPARFEVSPLRDPTRYLPLLQAPLRELTDDELGPYAFSAVSTVGTADDFRYFVPRVLELVVTGACRYTDVEVVLGKLRYAGLPEWPGQQRAAVGTLLERFWDAVLSTYPATYPVDAVLCGIAAAVDDITPFLERWAGDATESAQLHLIEFEEENADRLVNAYWANRPDAKAIVASWLAITGGRAGR
ncbi:hypothetical protein [Pseudonocardia sp. TRM90224]|uniref:hypothetical protein n=1 Tax=Pseudonocardia sp. TRM90224 TaxID=2812678 RepID=UPI001E63423D|nr:hypothetical protein [Pseudonocardia sp. TRM90224]